jgi:hypothetical protein
MIPALPRVLNVNFTILGTLREFEIQTLPGHFARFKKSSISLSCGLKRIFDIQTLPTDQLAL